MTHRTTMSSSRLQFRAQFVDFGDDDQIGPDGPAGKDSSMLSDLSRNSQTSKRKDPGLGHMAGAALESFVAGTSASAAKALFHRRRASSIVNRIIDMSEDDLKRWDRSRASHSKRLSRKSLLSGSLLGGGDMGRHSRAFSSGHFVNKFFKNADTREILEAGMRG
eukprot:468356_1